MISANLCGRCGGHKTVWFKTEVVKLNEPPAVQPGGYMKLCMCPIERPKHDGKLDKHYEVLHLGGHVHIVGDMQSNDMRDSVYLSPGAALSLLAWLKQEEATLEKLVETDE